MSESHRCSDCPKDTYNKFNPVRGFGNSDNPVLPAGYKPEDKHRVLKWHCRNPFHNFDHYVIGVADKEFVRSGKYPEQNSSPPGGWDFAVARRKLVLLPFISSQRGSFNFYFGWREHGNFGMKFNFSTPPGKATNEVSEPKPPPKNRFITFRRTEFGCWRAIRCFIQVQSAPSLLASARQVVA